MARVNTERETALLVFYDALLGEELQMDDLGWFMERQGLGASGESDRALLFVWLWQLEPLIEKISGAPVHIGPGMATWIVKTLGGPRGYWLKRVLVAFPEGGGSPVLISTSNTRPEDKYNLLNAAAGSIVAKTGAPQRPWTIRTIKLNQHTGRAFQRRYTRLTLEDLQEFFEWFEDRPFGQKAYLLTGSPWQDITDKEG